MQLATTVPEIAKQHPFNENNMERDLPVHPFEPNNSIISGFTVVSEVWNLSSLWPVMRMEAGNVAFLISLHTEEVSLHAHTPKHAQAFFPVSVTGTWALWFQMSKKSVAQH